MKSRSIDGPRSANNKRISTPAWTPAKDPSSPQDPIILYEPELSVVRYDSLKPETSAIDMTTPVVATTGNFVQTADRLHAALKPIIILAQCFAVFPVSGANKPDASYLKFTWRSFKILYFCISMSCAIFLAICDLLRLMTVGITSTGISTMVFVSTSCIANLLFLRLAMDWPTFATFWDKVERELAPRHRRVSKFSLSLRFKIVTAVIMVLALMEHSLSIVSGYASAVKCASPRGDTDIIAAYFLSAFPQVFNKTSYSMWKGIAVQLSNGLSTFTWNFMDLFLILISIALTDQFRQLNNRLYSIREKAMPEWWWAEARTDFNRLATLTRRVDAYISGIVLLSFGTNLWFICIQLLNSFNPLPNIVNTIYFCFSFGFLLSRASTVSLCAAAVHDESLLPAPILYSVSASSYSNEVVRFLMQVTTDNIGLTGMKFFSITRSLVLTVAGTIVTYELVLVQFNGLQPTNPSNITHACEVK